ncbi:STP1 protein [Plasmodium brasilianum]|uniref:STP1 protein n=1 Tax=Plasmodium brasilianum TaxID=5824 RepID=UPI00350E3DD0|nr:STP1 protein [Plasmodium brasilianum]
MCIFCNRNVNFCGHNKNQDKYRILFIVSKKITVSYIYNKTDRKKFSNILRGTNIDQVVKTPLQLQSKGIFPPDLNAPQDPDPQGSLSHHSPESPSCLLINEDWENNKEALLEICIDELAKEDYRTNPNLTDDDLTKKNIKSSNDIKKQNIQWNKWIERYRNLSEKLKKEEWYNNLKNEWKKELAYIQGIEELKKKSSYENRKILFLEIEKDLLKQWISENCNIIEQYLEQEWLKVLTEKFKSISKECVSEETINYISLINIEELLHKENYKELYKYIKKKLLTKLYILVLMSILEECTKEVNFDNRESYLDSSINEWKA